MLAVAAAVATSTSYLLQPELPVVARDVGSSAPVIGVVAALPTGGYLFGLALLVPLADRMRSHRLICGPLAFSPPVSSGEGGVRVDRASRVIIRPAPIDLRHELLPPLRYAQAPV